MYLLRLYLCIYKYKIVILTLSLQKTYICDFPTYFGVFLLSLDIKTMFIKFCTKFLVKRTKFLPSEYTSFAAMQQTSTR